MDDNTDMEAEQLAVYVTKELKPLLKPLLECELPETYNKIQEVIAYCGNVVSDAYIMEKTSKDCCG